MRQVLLLCLALLPLAAQERNPVRWSLKAPASAAPGKQFTAALSAEIDPGWHLYSLKELDGGPIPTRITLPEGQLFQLAGGIEAPPPARKHDESFDMEVETYSRQVVFTLPLASASDAAGPRTLTVAVRYQVCDDKICLPPRTVRTEASVELRK